MKKEEIIIFGTGGHAKVVYDIINAEGKYDVRYFSSLDKEIKSFLGVEHIFEGDLVKENIKKGIIALGDNSLRRNVYNNILKTISDFEFINAIHPSAIIGSEVSMGSGCVIMPSVTINHGTEIGDHVIINTSSSVDHECFLGHFSSCAPGAILGGNVTVGEGSALSLGVNVKHGISIGSDSVIGTGSTVLEDVEDLSVYFGTPARFIRSRQKDDSYL